MCLCSKMASGGLHSGVYAQPPPSFAQHGHSSSMNASFPQAPPPMNSFETQSVASTPAPTPPPPRPASQHQQQQQQQQQMIYNMNGGTPMSNGAMMGAPDSFGGYSDPNMYSQPNFYANGVKPQIYTVSTSWVVELVRAGKLTDCRRCTPMSLFLRWK